MSLNPLNELKRRLDDQSTPLPKRLCLAKNVVGSHHFPTAPKERVVGDWLSMLNDKNKLNSDELKGVLDWLSNIDDLTGELKGKLIQIVSHYVQKNPLKERDIQYIQAFLENTKISRQLLNQVEDYFDISTTLLQFLRNHEANYNFSQRILNNFIKHYKESKKKLEFITKLLNGANLETLFSYLNTECRSTVIGVCQSILFPINKRTFFISFLQTLIRKDNLDELLAEKGDNIQSVVKIMNTFYEFPKNRTENNVEFLHNFIDVFVSCYHSESQLIFAFYIMVADVLNMEQNYIIPAMSLKKIIEEDSKVKRSLFLNMLEVLLRNDVDINIRLTDTFGEKISKVEIRKNFTKFLQAVMLGQLKLNGKPDKTTLQIIKTALKLDPSLIEQKLTIILPPIMTAKKSASILALYTEMLSDLVEMLFKVSRGTIFINQILPFIKENLEIYNTEQYELEQMINGSNENGMDCDNIKSKVITGVDIFPYQCVILYGKLTSELMFRQNKELLELLQKDFEEHCLTMLEEGIVTPSIITLTEVLSAILSSFLNYNKMADHTVPVNIAEEFWSTYEKFEEDCLKRFGECVFKLNFNPSLLQSFLKLCVSFSQVKLLNIKYSHTKLNMSQVFGTSGVFDLTLLLPFFNADQWFSLASMVECDESVVLLDNLLLAKTMAMKLMQINNKQANVDESSASTKTHLIKLLNTNPNILTNNYFCTALFRDLDKSQAKILAKCLIKLYLDNPKLNILNIDAIANNRVILNALVLETVRNLSKCIENTDFLTKVLSKTDFHFDTSLKHIDKKKYFSELCLKPNMQNVLKHCVKMLKQLQIYYLEENYQLIVIFILLAIKKCCQAKKLIRNIDSILQSIYELSLQQPDLYQLFPVEFIFSFDDKMLLDLLTLKIKSTNVYLILKNILELAVKRVKVDSDLVKNIVELILIKDSNNSCNINSFSDVKFQITCLILPSIVKQKKSVTNGAIRSILADSQEKLHIKLLESFKNIEFSGSLIKENDNPEDSVVDSDNNVAILNAMGAHSLILSKYCESNESEEIKNLDCIWSGLEYFLQIAINSIENPNSKPLHVDTSIQYLNVILRYIKKLEAHSIFQEKDKLFIRIWRSIKTRLMIAFDGKMLLSNGCLEDVAVTLKFVCELCSVECYGTNFVADLGNLIILKKPSHISAEATDLTSRKVFKYLWCQCLKANIIGPKCVAMSKLMYRTCKNWRLWIRQHFEPEDDVASYNADISTEDDSWNVKMIKVNDVICELLRIDLDSLSELLLSAKKISIDYKFLDSTFELQHMVYYLLGVSSLRAVCDVSWKGYFTLYEGCITVLNNLLWSREEILEDRWPCYMQCYRALVTSLSIRCSSHAQLDRYSEEKLAEIAHSVEKLTLSISKRKKHVSRIATYTVADICTCLERNAPTKMVRQHLENSVALLIQASDSAYAMAFLKRALVGTAGQTTAANLYTMYKRYHKYVGNA